MRTIRVRVPCSTSNLGAGFDCIGLAFDRYLTATLHVTDTRVEIERRGTLASLGDDPNDDLVIAAARSQGCELRGRLELDSNIPVGRGLGSSAAAAVAGLMLAARLNDTEVEREVIAASAAALEGHPDNAVPCTFGGLMAGITETKKTVETVRVHRLRLSERIRFVFAAPQSILSTKTARRSLPEQVDHAAATRSLARVIALIEGLAEADPEMLRIGFTDELHVPYRLPLIPGGEDALRAAHDAGAYAATISGSGSGLIAACPPDMEFEVTNAMRVAFERATATDAIAFVAEPDLNGAIYLDS